MHQSQQNNLGARYQRPIGARGWEGSIGGDWSYVDEQTNTLRPTSVQFRQTGSYSLLDLRATSGRRLCRPRVSLLPNGRQRRWRQDHRRTPQHGGTAIRWHSSHPPAGPVSMSANRQAITGNGRYDAVFRKRFGNEAFSGPSQRGSGVNAGTALPPAWKSRRRSGTRYRAGWLRSPAPTGRRRLPESRSGESRFAPHQPRTPGRNRSSRSRQ